MIYNRIYLMFTMPVFLLVLFWYNFYSSFNPQQKELKLAKDFSDFEKSLNFCRSHHQPIFYSDQMPNIYDWTDVGKILEWPSYSEPDYSIEFESVRYVLKADPIGFNTMINNLIPLNRRLPNRRPEQCRYWHYDPGSMPTVTVIIPLHFENVRILSRTIISILLHTPRNLLAQIILAIDNEEPVDELISQLFLLLNQTNALENFTDILRPFLHYSSHFPLLFGEKFDHILIDWSGQRIGWSRSIESVLNKSIGDVLVFLKPHIEVSHDWLPPLLGPIVDDTNTITIPTLGRIDPINFTTSIEPRSVIMWDASLKRFPKQMFRMSNNDSLEKNWQTYPLQVDLLTSPQFAISKSFLYKTRLFDSDQVVGQNFDPIWDYTLKVARCGGRVLQIPCSTVYLLAKKGSDPMGQVIDQTYISHDWNYQPKCLLKLFVEHYFADDHSTLQAFNVYHPNLGHFPCKVSLSLPQQCSCKMSPIQITDGNYSEVTYNTMHWYPLIRIQTFVQQTVTINLHYGQLANIQYSVCMSPLQEKSLIKMIESYCYDKPITEALRLDRSNRLIYEEYCLQPKLESNEILAQPCSEQKGVKYEWKFLDGKLIAFNDSCLDYQPLIGFIYSQCFSNNSGLFWQWIDYAKN